MNTVSCRAVGSGSDCVTDVLAVDRCVCLLGGSRSSERAVKALHMQYILFRSIKANYQRLRRPSQWQDSKGGDRLQRMSSVPVDERRNVAKYPLIETVFTR